MPHRQFDMAMYAWISAPENVPRSIFIRARSRTPATAIAGQNVTGFKNPEMDRLIDAIEVELDADKRKALWARRSSSTPTELPSLPLYLPLRHLHPAEMAERGATDRQPVPDHAVDHRLETRAGSVTAMIRFTAIRLLEIAALLVLLSFVIYALIGLMPGDPIDLMRVGRPAYDAADVARLKAALRLDQPLVARYLAWAARGAVGRSRLFAAVCDAGLGGAVAAARRIRCC